jgi:hypothetical protein
MSFAQIEVHADRVRLDSDRSQPYHVTQDSVLTVWHLSSESSCGECHLQLRSARQNGLVCYVVIAQKPVARAERRAESNSCDARSVFMNQRMQLSMPRRLHLLRRFDV